MNNYRPLGEAFQITIGTSDLEKSIEFYEKLGFTIVQAAETPNPWAQMTDNSILILLNQDHMKYLGIAAFSSDMETRLRELESENIKPVHVFEKDGTFFQAIIETPDNFYIALIQHNPDGLFVPQGKKMLNIPSQDWQDTNNYANPRLGMFGELCHPVKDLNISITFWEKLGFTAKQVYHEPYPWTIVTDGFNVVGLHQTSEFKAPALTYFASDSGRRFENFQRLGLEAKAFQGDGPVADNGILPTPEGQQVFLFKV